MPNNNLSITNAKGRQVNLLNDDTEIIEQHKRRYHCTEPGCQKSFTTSGHLARHHRIHTGEKNFHCIYPGCPSRFSRQDNMMQHYRTHLSSRSRHHQYLHHYHQQRQQQQILHCHSYFKSERRNELYPLNSERGGSFSSTSSSNSTDTQLLSTPNHHHITPNHHKHQQQQQASTTEQFTLQNWNTHPNHKYSSASYYYYDEFV